MMAAIKSEFRKLTTTRSTWVFILSTLALCAGLLGFWVFGVKDTAQAAMAGGGEMALQTFVFAIVGALSLILSFAAVLSVGHEYRYNTVMYSLVMARSRAQVFFAKWLVLLVFGLVTGGLVIAAGIGTLHLGWSVGDINPVSQNIDWWALSWRSALAIAGGMTYAYMFTLIVRSQVSAFTLILLLSSLLESLAGLLLKENVKYLPYTSLSGLYRDGVDLKQTVLTVTAYMLGLGIIAYVLFRSRDAN